MQRASACLSLLFLTMISNAMFFETEGARQAEENWSLKVGPFRFSVHQLYTSFVSLLIVLPVNIVIVTLFRRSREPPRDTGDEPDKDPVVCTDVFNSARCSGEKDTVKHFENPNYHDTIWLHKHSKKDVNDEAEKKKKCCSVFCEDWPACGVKVAWILVFLACALSAFFLVLYSMDWGKAKSERWLTAFFLSFLQSLFLVDPVKVSGTCVCDKPAS